MSDALSVLGGSSILTAAQEERVREFTSNQIPTEISALGSAEAVHQPNPLWATLANCRYILAGVLLAAGGAGLGFAWRVFQSQGDWRTLSLAGFGLFALACLGAAFALTAMPVQRATFFLYAKAIVIASGGKLTLIPWKHVLFTNGWLWTSEGQRFYCGLLERHDAFEERIWDYSLKHWLPEAMAKVKGGGVITVGPLTVSQTHVSYCGKSVKWEDITQMQVIVGRFYQLNFHTKESSLFHWATINMHEIPNARCMEQLLVRICPERLLKVQQ
jgi:hypothetical protein